MIDYIKLIKRRSKMGSTGVTLAWVGALAAVVGSFWGVDFYLSAVGGVVVAVGLLMK